MKVCDVCRTSRDLATSDLNFKGFVADEPPRGLGIPKELTLCRVDQDLLRDGNWAELAKRTRPDPGAGEKDAAPMVTEPLDVVQRLKAENETVKKELDETREALEQVRGYEVSARRRLSQDAETIARLRQGRTG